MYTPNHSYKENSCNLFALPTITTAGIVVLNCFLVNLLFVFKWPTGLPLNIWDTWDLLCWFHWPWKSLKGAIDKVSGFISFWKITNVCSFFLFFQRLDPDLTFDALPGEFSVRSLTNLGLCRNLLTKKICYYIMETMVGMDSKNIDEVNSGR